MKITSNPRFKKYTMWLMTGDVAPEIGQISPALSPDGLGSSSSPQKRPEGWIIAWRIRNSWGKGGICFERNLWDEY